VVEDTRWESLYTVLKVSRVLTFFSIQKFKNIFINCKFFLIKRLRDLQNFFFYYTFCILENF
jgi:hypothetical protein